MSLVFNNIITRWHLNLPGEKREMLCHSHKIPFCKKNIPIDQSLPSTNKTLWYLHQKLLHISKLLCTFRRQTSPISELLRFFILVKNRSQRSQDTCTCKWILICLINLSQLVLFYTLVQITCFFSNSRWNCYRFRTQMKYKIRDTTAQNVWIGVIAKFHFNNMYHSEDRRQNVRAIWMLRITLVYRRVSQILKVFL